MRLYLIFICILFYGSISKGQVYGFVPAGEGDTLKDIGKTIDNMPQNRTQSGIGICSPVAVSAIFEHQYCVVNNVDCKTLSDDQRPSILALSRYSVDSDNLQNSSSARAYPKVINDEFSNAGLILENAGFVSRGKVVPESCAPFDAFVAKTQDPQDQEKIQKAIWENFKNTYETYQKVAKNCPKCAEQAVRSTALEWQEKYNLKVDNATILKYFAANTYQEFLFQLLIPSECYQPGRSLKIPTEGMRPVTWPDDRSDMNYSKTMEKIKSVLRSNQPLILSNICLLKQPTKACSLKTPSGSMSSGSHSVVIDGYKKMCKKSNPDDCYDMVKVHNSWGEGWQKRNNDGWVKAKELLDRTSYIGNNISWIEKKL